MVNVYVHTIRIHVHTLFTCTYNTLTLFIRIYVSYIDVYLGLLSIYSSSKPSSKKDAVSKTRKNGPWTFSAQTHSHTPIPSIGSRVSEWISDIYTKHQSLIADTVTEEYLYLLVLAIIEGLTYKCHPKNNSQLSACIQSITNLSLLLEDLLDRWINVRTEHPVQINGETMKDSVSTDGFLCTNLFYRIVLRVWLTLAQNTLLSLTTPTHNGDLQELLSRPITMVTSDSLSMNKDWLFLGKRSLDIEFSFTFLESIFACISLLNFFSSNSVITADNFVKLLLATLSVESEQLLVYLCSKLQSLPRQTDLLESVMSSLHVLICQLTREMITLSDHIQTCQQTSKARLLQKDSSIGSFLNNYDHQRAVKFDELEQRLCKISQSLLTIFDNVPNIQLLSLQLLAQTGLDKVGIINDFLPRVSHSSVWTMPEVLDLYLELLEKAWFQLSPEYSGSTEFWSKVSHYCVPLVNGSRETIMQVNYHLTFLFIHKSNPLKSALTQYILLQSHKKMLDDFQQKVYNGEWTTRDIHGTEFEIEEEKIYHQHLKLLQKMASHPSSLVPFLRDPQHLFLLFLFIPIPRFRNDTLAVFKAVLTTLSTPWEASIDHANKLTDNKIHYHLVNSLLRIAYEFKRGNIINLCHQLASSGISTSCLDIRHVDGVHRTIQGFLEFSEIISLLSPTIIQHLQLVADVWEVLSVSTETCTQLLHIMNNNQIWDVLQVLAPSLASLLERLQAWKTSEATKQENDSIIDVAYLVPLQETSVSLLCHLLAMAMSMCRLKDDPLKVSNNINTRL